MYCFFLPCFNRHRIRKVTLLLMTHYTFSDRRFLSFPAINPCSAVSPAALLADLSTLAADIDVIGRRQTGNFGTHRRAAREAFRYATIIVAFLDDLRPFSTALTRSAVLGLSDLHVTLQKLRLLLADCARGGARLWILLNASRIAGEFRVLLRSVSIALEFIPLDSVDLSAEIKDLVRLLAGQARRVEVGVERVDELAGRSVRSMLKQFQSGESPDPNDLRRVLNHLKITSWIDCFAEVAFLEEEIFAEERNGEATLLWSSMGLMVYSLVVLFDKTANDKSRKIEECFRRQESSVTVEKLNADDLRCPISLELMKDPVTVSTGQTYDRSSILRWLKSGNQTCPVTGEVLANADLIPNFIIRQLISLYCHENGILTAHQGKARKRDLSKTLSPASPAAVGAIRMATTVLAGKLATGESEKKNMASYEIRILSKSNIFNRICLVEAGAVKWLLSVLSSSSDPTLQDNAIAALLNLSKHHSGRTDIFEAGGLPPVVQVMRFGHKVESQKNAAAVLFYLSAMEACREAIGEIPEAIPSLVQLLKNGTYRAKKNAIVTIYSLLLFSGNQAKILAADTVAVIAELLESEEDEEDLVTDCVGVLAKIAERPDGTNEIIKSCVLSHLVHVLRSSSSSSGREYCVSALLSICKNGGDKAMSLLEKMPLLMPSLYSLLSDGSRQASKKARSLLNYIHQFNDQRYSPVLAFHDPIVHAL
ncbi:U-box domain-containing protein 19-like [Dendrobium catenatum]|uniref:RING-type E3 ubiquitin transferase n=1 Tax=Dendrobium catenatum TaxID=906689 RepID=A0A2I0W788_9ASPA|nr:U-box domain-containing protein 19-like [Dendrobium catenatum]PKU71511.1 U-box domain-containing protein 19 [Dendrobium catenatum]